MQQIRPPAVAGSFYPSDAGELLVVIENCFSSNPLGPTGHHPPISALLAGMVPHAGYSYSGPCAAHFYAQLSESIERVIILGVNHWARGYRAALSPSEFWQTPLGNVPVDQKFNAALEQRVPFLRADEAAHAQEHSIEVQLPFLQRVLGKFSFVPVSLARVSTEECVELGAAIAELCSTGKPAQTTVTLASSDLSHYLSPEKTDDIDRIALTPLLNGDPVGLLTVVEQQQITMCGVRPAAVMLYVASRLSAKPPRLLKHYHSGDVKPMRNVVGYASVVVELEASG